MTKPILLAKTTDLTRAEWLELRRQGIGGSDAAAIAGVNPWRGPLSVYLSKIGAAPDQDATEAMEFGTILETPIAEEFAKRTGYKIKRQNYVLQHAEYPWMLANVDRMVQDTNEPDWGVLEVKNVGEYRAEDWADDKIPEYYQMQGQHYNAVCDTGYVWFAPLIGGNRLRPIKLLRDEKLIAALIKVEEKFWHLVETRTPPPIDDTPEATKILKALYPESKATSVTIEADLYHRLVLARQRVIDAEKEARGLENSIKEQMREAESAYIAGESKPCITYKGYLVKRLDVAALEEAEPEICARYFKESTARRFLVK
jgi:putative phage-type endonuclease